MHRKQFTFYASFYQAVRRLKRKGDRADAYDIICAYALTGELPQLEKVRDEVAMLFDLVKPNLDASRKKAQGGSYQRNPAESIEQDTVKIGARYEQDRHNKGEKEEEVEIEGEPENKKENKKEKELENECYTPWNPPGDGSGFTEFWDIFPKKVGKQAAQKAFEKVDVSTETLLDAVRQQKRSIQWKREDGRFIPEPARWLKERRWEDQLAMPTGGAVTGGTGLGKSELEQLQREYRQIQDKSFS